MKKILIFIMTVSTIAFADDNAEATKKTQAVLRDKKARMEVIKYDPKAQQADKQVDLITGGDAAAKEEMYDISAELMPWIVEQSGGDTDKMNAMLDQALKNPEKFYQSMPESQRARIKSVSGKLEKNKIKP